MYVISCIVDSCHSCWSLCHYICYTISSGVTGYIQDVHCLLFPMYLLYSMSQSIYCEKTIGLINCGGRATRKRGRRTKFKSKKEPNFMLIIRTYLNFKI